MSASSALFYGIFVKTSTLITAAEGYSQIIGALNTIEMILWRRRKGTLASSSNSHITQFPNELWDLVREFMIARSLNVADQKLIAELSCEDCSHASGCFECNSERVVRRSSWSVSSCDACHDPIHEFLQDAFESNERLKSIAQMLQPFGLRLQSDDLIGTGVDPLYGDPNSLSPLSIIPTAIRPELSQTVDHPMDGGPARFMIQNMPSSTFNISPKTRESLQNNVEILCETFLLQAVDPAADPLDQSRPKEKKPRWIAYTSSDA